MRESILAEARRIVTEQGRDQLSMRAIARALGYSPGALYEYFRDKEAILHALYFDGVGGLNDHITRVVATLPPGIDPRERIRVLGRAYRTFALDHAELYRLVFGGIPRPPRPPSAEAADDLRGGFAVLVQAIQQGIDAGVLVDVPPDELGVSCWASVHGFVSLELSGHLTGGNAPRTLPASPEEGRRRRDDLFEQLFQTLFHGFVRDEDRAMPAPHPASGGPAQTSNLDN
jgi:AcrR family transcriptional regulator